MTRGLTSPPRAAVHLPLPNCPDANTSGWRRYVQAAQAKSAAANSWWHVNTPAPARFCAGAILSERERGMEMPQLDFKKPLSLKEALQRFSLELDCVMVRLRDEADFHDDADRSVLDAANLFLDVLDDTSKEAKALTQRLDRRITNIRTQ